MTKSRTTVKAIFPQLGERMWVQTTNYVTGVLDNNSAIDYRIRVGHQVDLEIRKERKKEVLIGWIPGL
jgi:hypothetical protein